MTLEQLIHNLELLRDTERVLNDAIDSELTAAATELNKKQLLKGETNEGEKIKRKGVDYEGYSRSYKRIKAAKGGQVNHIDLKLTGAYQNSFETVNNGNRLKLEVNENDKNKLASIEDNYENIYGLTKDNLTLFSEIAGKKVLQNAVNTILNK